jgi:DNA-binding NarL/FixJ family response regulator
MTDVTTARAVHAVLIVEDDPAMVAEATLAVSVFAGATVRTARTIAEAERWMARTTFDLAIVDLGLPDGSGISLIRTLMQDGAVTADVHAMPTVCVARTVFDDDAHLFAALSAGARGYLLMGEVGQALTLSVNTVKTHVKHVYARLDVSTRVAAVDTARRMGILDDDTRR